jgi:hypothetical protein
MLPAHRDAARSRRIAVRHLLTVVALKKAIVTGMKNKTM